MTTQEANALPIPEQYKNTPNLYRLARQIASSPHCDKILQTLPLILSPRNTPAQREEGETV